MLRLEEEQELLKAQIKYTKERNGKITEELKKKKGSMNSLQEINVMQKEKNQMLKQKEEKLRESASTL